MFIKFKVINYCLLFILVVWINFNSVISSQKIGDDTASDNKRNNSNIKLFRKDNAYQSCLSPNEKKTLDKLQAIIKDIYKKKFECIRNKFDHEITKKEFPKISENLNLEKKNAKIFAEIINEDTASPMVTTFQTQSSFPSSQLDNKKYDEYVGSRSFFESEESTSGSDLNEILTHTFQSEHNILDDKFNKGEKLDLENKTVEEEDTHVSINETVTISTSIDSNSGDIPSFREWAEKHLAEEEKERGDDNNTNVPTNGKIHKMRNKNYASLDCGAKLLSTNPEAKSAGSLLSACRDEYLLSPCNSKIWFVVELCETVQLKKIELANFELFSSSPRDFSVSISDRFPSRDWTIAGQFTAKDEKSIQSFNLQPHHFTKYIKVEFHSHYGKEHFCPVSLFRVYGTSEFEVLETVDGNEELENDVTDNDDEVNEPIMSELEEKTKKLETSNNLFGSARDAVINIVKKAAEVLVKSPLQIEMNLNLTNSSIDVNKSKFTKKMQCVTPRYVILCRDCKDDFFHKLYKFISCYLKDLNYALHLDIIWKPLVRYNICKMYGISPFYLRDHAASLTLSNHVNLNELYPVSLLPQEILAALCNLIAISENRMKQNFTLDNTLLLNQTLRKYDNASVIEASYNTVFPVSHIMTNSKQTSFSFKTSEFATSVPQSLDRETIALQIKPTKTFSLDSDEIELHSSLVTSTDANFIPIFPEIAESEQIKVSVTDDSDIKETETNVGIPEDTIYLDSLISELEKTEDSQQGSLNSIQTSVPKPVLQKESVFVRLANRIKALERNMSLSGQYLEELSRRYKKQVEDMQRVLLEAADDRQKSTEREGKLSQEIIILNRKISQLTISVNSLINERESWGYRALVVGEHSIILFIEIVIFLMIVCLCRGIPSLEISKRKFSLEWCKNKPYNEIAQSTVTNFKRRQSLDDLNVPKPSQTHKRRPSEEALKIDGSTHQDLLIYEITRTSKTGRKRKKRKELLLKSNANAINLETGDNLLAKKIDFSKINVPLSRSASASEADDHIWGRIDYNSRADFKENHLYQSENSYPHYCKTATSLRTQRLSNHFNNKKVLSPVCDVSTDQDSSVPSTPVKEKKVNGIKKIVKKFF